jgi:hypothetical protein
MSGYYVSVQSGSLKYVLIVETLTNHPWWIGCDFAREISASLRGLVPKLTTKVMSRKLSHVI